jgi:LysR family glycine cleavage system transcriptional activator
LAEHAGICALDTGAGITFNDENSAIQAAIAGQGVALLSRALVAAELASGALIQPFGPVLEGLRYDLAYPLCAETRPAVAVLRSWVMTELARHLPAQNPELAEPSQTAALRAPSAG